MDRSSKAITLALIGSAFLLGGCSGPETAQEEEENNGQAVAGNGGHGSRGVFIAPRIGGGFGGGGGGGVAPAPSARGGFGSTGSASVGS